MTELEEWVAESDDVELPEDTGLVPRQAGAMFRCDCPDCRALRAGKGHE